MNVQIKMTSWLILHSPSRPVLSRHVPLWWVHWVVSQQQPSAQHLKTGLIVPDSKLQLLQRAVSNNFNINICADHSRQIPWQVLLGLTMPSVQLQSNATGYGWLCRVEQDGDSWVFQGQLFQNEHPISRSQTDASALMFFVGKCVDQRLSNCLIFFIYAARRLII